MIKNDSSILLIKELRSRLIYVAVYVILIFSILIYFANDLYSFLAKPLLKYLPHGHLIATQLVSPFFVPFKLAFFVALLLSVPFFLYQLWIFIAPALYGHEKRLIWPSLSISIILFYVGVGFAYYVVFPALFHFLSQTVPENVTLSPDIGDYLDLSTKLILIFGGLFEIPMIMVFLISFNIVSRKKFIQSRSYAIVSAFIIAMLIAPPDIISQTILAIPIWLLYEIGIVLSVVLSIHKS